MADPVLQRDGKAFIKDAQGNIYTVSPEAVQRKLDSGEYQPASAADIAQREAEKQHGGLAGQAKTAAKAVGAGVFDAATALVRAPVALGAYVAGTEDPLAEVSGRQAMEDLAYIGGELGGVSGEAAAREWTETTREQALANPGSATMGYIAGEILGSGGLAGLARQAGTKVATAAGSKALGMAATGALEGGALGATAAGEQAYLEDTTLTAERTVAAMGLGALLGGGVGLGAAGLSRVFSRSGSRGMTPVDSPNLLSGKADEALETTAERALGVPPAPGLGRKLREAIEEVQAATAGVDKKGLAEVGALRVDDAAKKKRSLWWNRDKVWEDSTTKLTGELEKLADDADEVFDEVVDSGLKRDHIASRLKGNADEMVAAAQNEFRQLRQELTDMSARADDYGNQALIQKQMKLLDAYEPSFAMQRAAGMESKAMAADAFIALDKTKRAMQKYTKALRRSSMGDDAYKQMQNRALADAFDASQERTRTLLEDAGLWGDAGAAQKSVNNKWQEYIRTSETFRNAFMRRVEGVDYQTGRAVWRVDPDKVAGYIRKTGRSEGQLVDEYFRRHIQARRELAEAIDGAYDLGAKAQRVKGIKDGTLSVQKTLGELDETAKAVNQIEAIMEAERTSGVGVLGGLGLGGFMGGGLGAAAGAAFGVASRPGQMIRQMAAIEQLSRNVDSKLAKGFRGFFARVAELRAPRLPGGVAEKAKTAGRTLKRAPVPSALAAFQGKEASVERAYERRLRELHALSDGDWQGVRDKMRRALGDEMLDRAPRLSGAIAATSTSAVEFLKSKLPGGVRNPSVLEPTKTTMPSRLEIAKFARYWAAVANPLGLLEELENGTLTHEHVEAVRTVYPRLYEQMQQRALEAIQQADAAGEKLPYQARLQLDMLLDLQGAGEPTMAPDFMARFAQLASQQAPQVGQPSGSGKPVQVASRLRSATESITLTADEARR